MDNFASADTLIDADYDRVIAINLTVPIKLIRAALPHLKETGGGAIVNVARIAGTSGGTSGIAYTASKHGLVSLECSFLLDLSFKNIFYRSKTTTDYHN